MITLQVQMCRNCCDHEPKVFIGLKDDNTTDKKRAQLKAIKRTFFHKSCLSFPAFRRQK